MAKEQSYSSYRIFLNILTILLGFLFFWLINFVLNDIRGAYHEHKPNYALFIKKFQDPALLTQSEQLTHKINQGNQTIQNLSEQQKILEQSNQSYHDVISQLSNVQKNNADKAGSAEFLKKINDTTQLYLTGQAKFQSLNADISTTKIELQNLIQQNQLLENELNKQRDTGIKAYNQLNERYNMRVGGTQILFLLLCLGGVIFLSRRAWFSNYKRIAYALGSALVAQIGFVMFEHFPSRYYKYILILTLIYVVVHALIKLLIKLSNVKQAKAELPKSWLYAQYRQAYQKLICPVCEYSIRSGFFKIFSEKEWMDHQTITSKEVNQDYFCPSCGTSLFNHCQQCQQVQHSLLPFCDHCGVSHEVTS